MSEQRAWPPRQPLALLELAELELPAELGRALLGALLIGRRVQARLVRQGPRPPLGELARIAPQLLNCFPPPDAAAPPPARSGQPLALTGLVADARPSEPSSSFILSFFQKSCIAWHLHPNRDIRRRFYI